MSRRESFCFRFASSELCGLTRAPFCFVCSRLTNFKSTKTNLHSNKTTSISNSSTWDQCIPSTSIPMPRAPSATSDAVTLRHIVPGDRITRHDAALLAPSGTAGITRIRTWKSDINVRVNNAITSTSVMPAWGLPGEANTSGRDATGHGEPNRGHHGMTLQRCLQCSFLKVLMVLLNQQLTE